MLLANFLQKTILDKKLVLLFILCTLSGIVYAQTAQKPSANYTQQTNKVKTQKSHLTAINNRKDFDMLTRVYNKGTFNEMPHLLFAIDRKQNNKVYYINTPKYDFHVYFINEILGQTYTPESMKPFYTEPNRRFIVGTLSFQKLIDTYTYEFWEGDKITPEILACTQKTISESFADHIIFKTNSTLHEEVANKLPSIEYTTQEKLVKEHPYIALNQGKTKGRIRIADSIENLKDISDFDIVVLREVPISIPAVAGVISEKASTLLSHINVLARGLNIPSIYLKNASELMKPYDGKFVEFKAYLNKYEIKEIDEQSIPKSKQIKYSIKSNITKSELIPLAAMRKSDYIYCGAKAANLGEIKLKIKDVIIPDGFSIPFAHYHSFVKRANIHNKVKAMQETEGFENDPEVRKNELAKLRNYIETYEIDSVMSVQWVQQWEKQLKSSGVFLRSSSNAEDLKNFSGAGLFSTVPNVKTSSDLIKAVQTVWASVYNFEAYESRRRTGIADSLIMMSVFVQLAANSDISGVMVTKDPYNPLRWDVSYIAAKRGIGIKVVEGKRIAEQVMFSEKTKTIQLISRSAEDTELRLDEHGGVKEVAVQDNKRVMSDELVRELAAYGKKIKKLFNNDMDIEWAVANNEIIILQARPYK